MRVASAPDRIVLFGSYAKGPNHPGSDVDLLVVSDQADESVAVTQLGTRNATPRIRHDRLWNATGCGGRDECQTQWFCSFDHSS